MNRRQIRAGWRARLRGQQSDRVAPFPPPAVMQAARLSVHIAELHMQSFQRSDALRIADGLKQELSLLLAREGVPQTWLHDSSVDSIKLADLRLRPAGRPQVIAQRLAQALVQTRDWHSRK